MIELGAFDDTVSTADRDGYVREIETLTRVTLKEVTAGRDRIAFAAHTPDSQAPMTVAQAQQALKDCGFFPGGKADGICGYRTTSAIRLFQEYVRTFEKLPSLPDGRLGPQSQAHLRRWVDGKLSPQWTPQVERWRNGSLAGSEFAQWLDLLGKVREQFATHPPQEVQLAEAAAIAGDTRKLAAWDLSPNTAHLIGVRRHEKSMKFDDIFVLLIKGLVFKFQGTTEPGAAKDPQQGAPFLVRGQHDYHFGWHKLTYLALRPQSKGVLVFRSKNNMDLDDADLTVSPKPEATINIHWGGLGLKFDVNTWSEGCQVMNGTAYLTPDHELVNCSTFAAVNNKEIAANPSKTRGAYNMVLDLVTALGSDLPAPTVRYSLLGEGEMALDPALRQGLVDARAMFQKLLA